MKDSSIWLSNGNVKPQDEARYRYMEDRNMFGGEKAICPHFKAKPKQLTISLFNVIECYITITLEETMR